MSRLIVCFIFGFSLLGFQLGWECPAALGGAEVHAPRTNVQAAEKKDASSEEDQAGEDQPEENQPSKQTHDKTSETDESDDGESAEDAGKDDQPAETSSDSKDKEKSDDKAEADEENGKQANDSKKKPDAKKSEVHQVERKPLKIEVNLSGIFTARQMEEVALRPEIWTQFKVVEAVEHGTRVKKGDVLVRFDDEKIETKLAQESLDLQLSELALMREEEEFPRVEKAMELNYDQAKRAHEELQEDYEHYQKTTRPLSIKITKFLFKRAQENLASQREELEQLEKMYGADELTEETEEIVLRRQRFKVEMAELVLELESVNRDHSLNVLIPRRDEKFVTSLEEVGLAFKQAKTAKNMGLTRERYELEQKRKSRARKVEQHAKLLSDRALMELRAPADGVVYYGRCVKGRWGEISTLTSKLRPHGTVSANTVLMTIVQQRPLYVETSLSEKSLPDFKEGLAAVIVPEADEQLELPGKVTEISAVLGGNKKFALQLDVDTANAPPWLVAGMTCKAKIPVYENENAIVIPSDLVQTDDENEKIKYVMLVDPESGEPVRRKVKLGRRKGKTVEILQGLDEGDQIVKESKK